MPNDKRQRHKAGRDARRAALEAQRRRQQNRKRAVAAVIVIAIVVGLVALVAGTGGDDGTDVATDDTTTTVAARGAEYGTTPCPDPDGEAERTVTFEASFRECLEGGADYHAVIEFDNGTVEIDLAEEASPVTVNNFVSLARHRFYDDVICHRVLKGFVVQCGDPEGTGRGGPGYSIGEEPPADGYEIGQVAMAKASAPGSTGSQFFLITGERGAQLPPEYSLLGTITEGFDVAQAIEADGSDADPAPPAKVHKILKVTIEER